MALVGAKKKCDNNESGTPRQLRSGAVGVGGRQEGAARYPCEKGPDLTQEREDIPEAAHPGIAGSQDTKDDFLCPRNPHKFV